MNFSHRIAEAARTFPDRVAIEWVGPAHVETTTYAALQDEASRVAGWLATVANVAAGDRVAILGSNDAHWVAAYLGVMRLGALAVPLDTAYAPAQVAAVISDSGARVLFTTPRLSETAHASAREAAPPPVIALLSGSPEDVAWRDGSDATSAVSVPADVEPDAGAVILYTSGTTADPKGVVLTHANLDAERVAVLSVVRASDEDVVLGVLPLFHALAEMANLWLPLTIGARVVFLETVSSTTLLDALQTRGITILACVPQFFYLIHQRVAGEFARRGAIVRRLAGTLLSANRIARDRFGWNPGRRIFARVHRALGPRIRLLITGGSRFDPDIARDLYGLGVSVYNGYGLTETSGAVAIVHAGDRFSTSVGPPLPGTTIRIAPVAASAGSERHDDGEVLVRGPLVMREYYRRPDATAEAIRDGWLHTGDLGRFNREGRLYITGRLKEIIVLSSGKNLYPEEIEAHYRQSPFIKELCVMGLTRPGEPAAERLHAVVVLDEQVLRERGIVNVRELVRFELEGLSVQLPAHKRILGYDVLREPLARTTTGKLKRAAIARDAEERAVAPAAARPVGDADRAWLAERDHAGAVAAITERTRRAAVHPDANLELDLGLDSMERVELLTLLETRAGTRVPTDACAAIFTVRQLVDAVEQAPRASPGAGAQSASSDLPWDTVLAQPPDPELVEELKQSKFLRASLIYAALRVCLFLAKVLFGLRVSGRANVPETTPFLVCPNHQTFLDGFIVASALPFRAFRQIFFVGAAEFFETRFMAWGGRAINIVPLDPDANLVNAMQAAATGLRLGRMLMLFPEGERTIDGTIKPFRKGAAILASHLDVPIVPVALDGLFGLWPRGRGFQWHALLPWRRGRMSLVFGEPLRVARGDYAESTEALRSRVAAMLPSVHDHA